MWEKQALTISLKFIFHLNNGMEPEVHYSTNWLANAQVDWLI